MSDYKSHIAYGLSLGLVGYFILILFDIQPMCQDLLLFPILIFASILPDIDIRTSKAYKILMLMICSIILYGVFFNHWVSAAGTFTIIVLLFMKHRGITHSVWFWGFMSLPIFFAAWKAGLFFMIGIISHLALDRRK